MIRIVPAIETPSPTSLRSRVLPSRRLHTGAWNTFIGVCLTLGIGLSSSSPWAATPPADRGLQHSVDVARDARVGPALARLASGGADDPVAAWVFFTDRAGAEFDAAAYEAARRALSSRALDRRLRRGGSAQLMASDLPVHAAYVRALSERGARVRGTSRWLNAASVEAPARLAIEFARLPFVARVELVPVGRRSESLPEPESVATLAPGESSLITSRAARPARGQTTPMPGDTAYYGGSFRQLEMMQVPDLHAMGLSGAGVLVCVIDTGFRLTHRAFSGLQVLASRDFVHGDSIVADEAGQDSVYDADHGTTTLACLVGSSPGTYSGAAFGVTVALAKTEVVPTETPVEMDYWQFAAEWVDSLGADIISSSLGYSSFDGPYPSYTYADMDGRTTVITRAAVEAARRGITVVVGAGNEGIYPWHYIIAPADADSVITCGAVDSLNVLRPSSSRGPTADGRIKPDVTAMGTRVFTVNARNDSTYQVWSGTSFSTPLTAGLVALLLQAHPTWGPFEVREALRETALNHDFPNNDIGWGLVQGLAARWWTPSTDVTPEPRGPSEIAISVSPNPIRARTIATIRFSTPGPARVRVEVLDAAGRRCARLYQGSSPMTHVLRWNGVSDAGTPLAAGTYWIRLVTWGAPSAGGAAGGVNAPTSRAVRVALMR